MQHSVLQALRTFCECSDTAYTTVVRRRRACLGRDCPVRSSEKPCCQVRVREVRL